MVPDYSPAMLRLFLAGRATRLAGADGLTPRAARRKLTLRLRREAGVSTGDLAAAFAGTLRKATPRARLWAALDHFPSDHGVMLTDDGGQASSISPLVGGIGSGANARAAQPATAGRASPARGRNGVGANEKDPAHG